MISFRTLFYRTSISLCSLALILASGCATATKPTQHPVADLSPTPLPVGPNVVAPARIIPSPTPPPAVANTHESPVEPVAPIAPPVVASRATIKGSQEASILLDNFTAFVASIDGRKNTAGRNGWDSPFVIDAGHRVIEAEFNRGVFMARTTLVLEAKANAQYALKYATDAELFGHTSYCNFWVVDLATGQTVTAVEKASVEKIAVTADHSILP